MRVTKLTWPIVASEHPWHSGDTPVLRVDAAIWHHPDTRLLTIDRCVHEAEDRHGPGFAVEVRGPGAERALTELVVRYQRLFTRRNAASEGERFSALLTAHRALHAREKPLVRADHDHALDTWQWVLRLAPEADEALQAAALLHDVERLDSEADQRIEQHAPDYLAFKQRHAQAGATRVRALLSSLGFSSAVTERAAWLVARHEQPEHDQSLGLLNDADALSFFALNSPGYLAYFGLAQTRKKVAYTRARMRSPSARAALATVRLEPEIAAMLAEGDQPT